MYPAEELKEFLEEKSALYNQPEFIEEDPIIVPHRFSKRQDIEIAGFFAAVLAWGQRKTIIRKSNELMQRMDDSPHAFILHHQDKDLQGLLSFKHRTFNTTDTLYFVHFLRDFYMEHHSLENLFSVSPTGNMEENLIHFHHRFFSLPEAPQRTRKHIPTPLRKSTCKRLNMYLRWMVRNDQKGVDFGLWNQLSPANLICPVDLHVDRVARKLGLITRKQTDWLTAMELTDALRELDPADPVKYDFALFGLGVIEKHNL